ncbi:MAG: hypothetical protein R8F63_17095 [Acidimicrobiales bacterium]|nr:hypothetical protein [Acidimicrobiales bacterium]
MFTTLRHRLVSILIGPFVCLSLLATACGADEAADAAGPAPTDPPVTTPIDDAGDDGSGGDESVGDDADTDDPVELPNEVIIDAPGLVIEEVDGVAQVSETATGELELPDWLEAMLFSRGLVGRIGTDFGRDLAHLDAHLHDDVLYWYVVIEQDTVLELDLDGLSLDIPRQWNMAGKGNSVLVLDPVSGYVYAGMSCPGITLPVNIDLQISGFEGGCGVGFALDGSIPVDFRLADTIHGDFDSLHPQLVVDGEFPVGPVNVAGSVFVDFDPSGLEAIATGQFGMGLPGKLGVVPISVPIGNGTLGIDHRLDGAAIVEKTWVNGYLGDDIIAEGAFATAADFLALQGDVDVDGFLHRRLDPAAPAVWETDSYLDVEGEGAWNPQRLMPAGVDHDTLSGSFAGRIDVDGIRGVGTVTSTPFATVELAAEGNVAFEMLYEDLGNSFLQIDGTLEVGGVDLVEGELRIDADGVKVDGRLGVGGNFVAIGGRIGPGGVELSGEVGVTIDLTDLDALAAKIAGEQGEDETIDRLEAEIDELAPHAAIQNLLDEVSDAYDGIATREALIEDQRDTLEDLARTWDGYTPLEKVGKSVSHGIRVTAANTAIAGLKVDIGRLRLVILGADGLVALYKQFVPDARPVDVERFEALKELLRLLKWERFWSNVRGVIAGVVRGAGTLLEAFGLDLRIEGRVRLAIGTDGLDAEVIASVCGDDWCVGIDTTSFDPDSGRTCIGIGDSTNCGTV